MNSIDIERLKKKIQAVNNANSFANRLYLQLIPIFKQCIGEDVENGVGKLPNRIVKILPEIPCTNELQAFEDSSPNILSWTVHASVGDKPFIERATARVIIGYKDRKRGGILTAIAEPFNHKSDYTFAEIEELIQRVKEAKKEFNKIRDELRIFNLNF